MDRVCPVEVLNVVKGRTGVGMDRDDGKGYERILYACMGDSITSEQVTGIGTMVCSKLGMELFGNFACGWATGSDWHDGDEALTPCSVEELPNEFSPKNVLSNQVRRLLQAAEESGRTPRVIYIAISTNDGARDWRAESPVPLVDDTELVCRAEYGALTRQSLASALRWAVETLRQKCPGAEIFVASPLQAYAPEGDDAAIGEEALLTKREIIRKISGFCGVHFVDSYYESGFTREVASEHGQVHPDAEWADRIAEYVAAVIRERIA